MIFYFMQVSGFEKLTLLDYPGKLAAVVFTPGCVFRCPFCHNPELIEPVDAPSRALFLENREEEFFAFLQRRMGKLDGVCITGGEPTLQKDLARCIRRIKDMGFLVKLDTNGLFPEIVSDIMKRGIVDYWAMDIKHAPDKYHIAAGKKISMESIRKSISLIMKSGVEYEFRTTVVPGIHAEEDFLEIARWIRGAHAYYLQEFRAVKLYDVSLKETVRGKSIDLDKIKKIIEPFCGRVDIRR